MNWKNFSGASALSCSGYLGTLSVMPHNEADIRVLVEDGSDDVAQHRGGYSDAPKAPSGAEKVSVSLENGTVKLRGLDDGGSGISIQGGSISMSGSSVARPRSQPARWVPRSST